MTDKPEITPEMEAAARDNPNGWVYKVDWPYPEDQHIPPEAIVGAFKVNEHGKLTGDFEANANYRPVKIASRSARDYMNIKRQPYEFNRWETEVDPAYDEMFPKIPPEGQIGEWYVGPDGKLTGQFRPNPHYKGSMKT
jgi:hypothetical protein